MPKKNSTVWFWIILFIIILVVVYILSLGKVDISKTELRPNIKSPDEFKDNEVQAQCRHDRLKSLIDKKEGLKLKLNRRFKWIYFFVRLGFICLWAAYILLFIYLGKINDLESALNYSEAAILVWLALNFLTFGRLSNLHNFINLIKLKLENWIWGKYLNIDIIIEANKGELKELKSA